jgi:hypothetical protein
MVNCVNMCNKRGIVRYCAENAKLCDVALTTLKYCVWGDRGGYSIVVKRYADFCAGKLIEKHLLSGVVTQCDGPVVFQRS